MSLDKKEIGRPAESRANKAIRDYCKKKRVPLWRVAEALSRTDAQFSRLLRHELPAEDQKEIIRIVDHLAEERRRIYE